MRVWQPEKFEKIFIEDSLQKEFLENGFCKIGIDEATIDRLNSIFNKFWKGTPNHFAVSHFNDNYERNKTISSQLLMASDNVLNDLFCNFKSIIGHLINKPANFQEEFKLHRDWSYVNEEKFIPVQLWIPLQDVEKENGSLFLVPKSHKELKLRSASYGIDVCDFNGFKDRVYNINLLKGNALAYHPGILHGSYPNQTNQNRKAVLISITHLSANLLYFEKGAPPKDILSDFFLGDHFKVQLEFNKSKIVG